MSQSTIRNAIEKILDESHTGILATVKNNKPYSRYMTFFHRDTILYTPTDKNADKTEDIDANPYTHILIGYEGGGFGDDYIEYQGKARLNDSDEMKKTLWNDDMKLFFDGPEDPAYTLLEIHPTGIRLMNKKGEPPKELEL